jgi:three-Cys-motif partner protein
VLEVQPQFLRNFILCEIETDKIAALEALKAEHASRSVHVLPGDFNRVVDRILETGMIDDKEATFCLIDQRTFECEWSTVVKLARHKTTYKIELFYFLAQWWLDRALEATKDEDQLARWWGRSDWTVLRGTKAVERAKLVVERLRLLGYRYVHAWPIYGLEHQSALMYHMIHAADHGEAPKLMARAYKSVVGRDKPVEQGDFFPGH